MRKRHKKKPKPSDNLEIEITLQEKRWMEVIPGYEVLIPDLATQTLQHVLNINLKTQLELSIVLANNDFIQELNSKHRHKDQPTNVLAFPNLEDARSSLEAFSTTHLPLSLGDIVLALETLEIEAVQQNKLLINHFSHLLVHGILHLLGFDHQDQVQAHEMEALEIVILKSRGIANPYESTSQHQEDTCENNF